ncbi:hypothetical protein MP638_005743 [Amoeboaphelidium occidentale]|nr:hypothetical protein MP638_005743 [Amoeboaphelidium occidentale]
MTTMNPEQLTPLEQVQLEITDVTKKYNECSAKLMVLLDKTGKTEEEKEAMAGYREIRAGLSARLETLVKTTKKKMKEPQLSVIGDCVYPFSVWSSSCSSSSSSRRQSKPIRQPGQKQLQISQPLLSKSSQSRMFISQDSETSVKRSKKDELLKKEE